MPRACWPANPSIGGTPCSSPSACSSSSAFETPVATPLMWRFRRSRRSGLHLPRYGRQGRRSHPITISEAGSDARCFLPSLPSPASPRERRPPSRRQDAPSAGAPLRPPPTPPCHSPFQHPDAAKVPHLGLAAGLRAVRAAFQPTSRRRSCCVLSQIVSLTCPLSFLRMAVPARGRHCRHLQCFDLSAFLEACLSKTGRRSCKCPLCPVQLRLSSLVVDDFIADILRVAGPAATRVQLLPDGTWRPLSAKRRREEVTVEE
eukprot:GGOE01043933.1.p2 GENE.GGOE01043933.1~~GGOE01043933.1.p2  ORF type:complete len:260 (+),score=37.07 GGOE01043933.1:28-807(+)